MNRYPLPLVALGLAGLLAACAPAVDGSPSSAPAATPSQSSEQSSPSPSVPAMPPPSASPIASHDMGGMDDPGMEVAVAMENFVFVEDRIEMPVGTTVTWTNGDATRHTVTSGADDTDDGTFDSGDIGPGETFSHTFDEPGEFAYFCDIHPTMTGVVVVTP